jgi:hypothetical protein
MLTQAAPAVVKALVESLPEQAVRALTQAIGNCNQPLTHRGPLNIQPYVYGNRRGVYTNQRWNPADYKGILPNAGESDNVDLPGYNAGDWNSVNYAGGNFFFPTDQYFDESNFYGGPTTNIGGDTNFETINATTINVTNVNTTNINGGAPGGGGGFGPNLPTAPDPGVPGDPNYGPPIYPPVGGGSGGFGYRSETLRYLRDARLKAEGVSVMKATTASEPTFEDVTVVTDVWFVPETCEVASSTQTIRVYDLDGKYVFSSPPPRVKVARREGLDIEVDRATTKVLVP